jgi:hypothetical protein
MKKWVKVNVGILNLYRRLKLRYLKVQPENSNNNVNQNRKLVSNYLYIELN